VASVKPEETRIWQEAIDAIDLAEWIEELLYQSPFVRVTFDDEVEVGDA
jgi:hypothetical protein